MSDVRAVRFQTRVPTNASRVCRVVDMFIYDTLCRLSRNERFHAFFSRRELVTLNAVRVRRVVSRQRREGARVVQERLRFFVPLVVARRTRAYVVCV